MLWWLVPEAANISSEPAPRSAGTHTLPAQSGVVPTPADKRQTMPAVVSAATADASLQRAQSARYPPEKRPERKSLLNRWWLACNSEWNSEWDTCCSMHKILHRVTTCLENLEMLGNLTAVRDFTKSRGNVRGKILSGKSCLKLFIISCIFASIQVFSRSLFCVKY